ncbi:MAG: hypothetical protein K2P65_11865 [Lachnospiraceae bacterium]|nr:hypothetical protein [Lachnospiraceae bacterium]
MKKNNKNKKCIYAALASAMLLCVVPAAHKTLRKLMMTLPRKAYKTTILPQL